ncbi:MAG: DUF2156 domain-containing protein [Candidatus Pacebacteria bacterium]|nr:DUF2156 domain-containing protein [Candidatus Paceibacterota bacterium]
MQLPTFPDFKSVRELDATSIHCFSEKLQPYSDYIFSNIWSWNIDGSFKASELNGNLVLFMRDANTKEFFFSLHGTNDVSNSLHELFDYIETQDNVQNTLMLVPEETAELADIGEFEIKEDRDCFDYVYSTTSLMELLGKEYKSKRHLVNQFTLHHENFKIVQKQLIPEVKMEILRFMSAENRKRAALGYTPFVEYEMAALEHFFLLPHNEKMIASMLYVDNNLIGFTVDEIVFKQYALSHFFKVDSDHRGAYDILNTKTAKFLNESGVTYWNWVEDLGLDGLRQAKLSYRPSHFLKKFKVTRI